MRACQHGGALAILGLDVRGDALRVRRQQSSAKPCQQSSAKPCQHHTPHPERWNKNDCFQEAKAKTNEAGRTLNSSPVMPLTMVSPPW